MARSKKNSDVPSPPSEEARRLFVACDEIITPELLSSAMSRVHWPHRDRILRPEVMLIGLLRMVMLALPSFLQLVDAMWKGLFERKMSFSPAAFYKRLEVMPHDLFRAVLQEVSAVVMSGARERKGIRKLAPNVQGIYAIDDTTLDALMRKTSSLQAHPKGSMATLAGRLSCALDLCTGLMAEVLYDPDAKANEKPHFGKLLEVLGTNNLFVLDVGYFSFSLFDRLTESGNLFVTRMRKNTSFTTERTGVMTSRYRESLVYLGKHRADQAAHPVRFIEILINGEWHEYLTNAYDVKAFPAASIWKLYCERWGIEQVFAVLKQALKLAYIHPCHTNGILAQVWSTLTVYQLLQDLRLRAAEAHKCGADDISWYNLMQRIHWYTLEKTGRTLTEYLTDRSSPLRLEKRGTRERVPKKLVGALGRDLRQPPIPWTIPPPRQGRQGKPEPQPDLSATVLAGIKR